MVCCDKFYPRVSFIHHHNRFASSGFIAQVQHVGAIGICHGTLLGSVWNCVDVLILPSWLLVVMVVDIHIWTIPFVPSYRLGWLRGGSPIPFQPFPPKGLKSS